MIKIYGGSDDLCEVEGVDLATRTNDDGTEMKSGTGIAKPGVRDEIGCYERDVHFVIGQPEAKAGENAHGIRVWLHYTDLGVWAVSILPLEEDAPCRWPVRVRVEGYTAVAEIDAPPGTPVTYTVVEAA